MREILFRGKREKDFRGRYHDADISFVVNSAISLGRFEVVFDEGCFIKKGKCGRFLLTASDQKIVGNIEVQK